MKSKFNSKVFSLVLAASMSFTALSTTAFAADVKSTNSFATELQSQLNTNGTSNDYLNKMYKNVRLNFTNGNKIKTAATTFTGNPFAIIARAAQTMKTEQIKMDKIMNEINMADQYRDTIHITITSAKQKPALTTFGIYSYIEHGTVHNNYDETVHRANLPLSILIYQEGYGEITGISIDGVALKSALVAKAPLDDNTDVDAVCAQVVTLDESLISSLSDGSHRIDVSCTGTNGTSTDYFTFALAN